MLVTENQRSAGYVGLRLGRYPDGTQLERAFSITDVEIPSVP